MKRRFNTLSDYLLARPLTVDTTFPDGFGASVALKGREIEAVILFADITSFSTRSQDLNPTETLIFCESLSHLDYA